MRCLFFFIVLIPYLLRVQSTFLNDVLSVAFCKAQCLHELCSQKCRSSVEQIKKIPLLQRESNVSITLQCKSANRLILKHNPGIYVIESKSNKNDDWTFPIISEEKVYVYSNLKSGNEYQYRVYEVTSQGVALPIITPWFRTNEENYIPKEVKNVSLGEIEIIKKSQSQLQANLNIDPADDFNCLYDIIHWGEEHNLYQYQLDAIHEYHIKLKHLEYDRNNTVYVISRNEVSSQQSRNVTFKFRTPSCLNIHQNLSICSPPPVTGLQVIEFLANKNTAEIKIAWDKPELYPDNYTVIVQPIDCENSTSEVTIFGNDTFVNFQQVALSRVYKIGVISESEGGSSYKWKIFSRTEKWTIVSQILIISATLTTIVIFLTIAYTYYRSKHVKEHACQHSFFENLTRKSCSYCAFDDAKSPLNTSSIYETQERIAKDKFEVKIDRLVVKKILGSGISGVVKLASLQDDKKNLIDVAVKMLREDASADDIKNFRREILLMKSAGKHRNIVSLIGYCTMIEYPILIVEYCSKGDLQTYLRMTLQAMISTIIKQVKWQHSATPSFRAVNNCLYDIQEKNAFKNKLSSDDLLNFAWQVACGMEFLSLNRIVHRDLAARNVLVCADKTIKISDFGLSRDIYQENVYKKQSDGKLPIKWMAIEALTHQIYTTHSDVWSYGILLYEIVTFGGNPYPDLQSSQILHFLKAGYRMEKPSNCEFQLYDLMRSCWNENPLNRPTFQQIKQELQILLSSIPKNEYVNLSDYLHESKVPLT